MGEQAQQRGRLDRDRGAGELAVVGGTPLARRQGRVQRRLRRGAGDPVPAVEHERRVPGAAVGRADRIRPIRGGEEQRHREPRQRDAEKHGGAGQQPNDAPLAADQQAEQGQRRQRNQPLEQLDVEREAHHRRREVAPALPSVLCEANEQPQRDDAEQHRDGVHGVAARRQQRDRQRLRARARGQAGGRAEHATNGVVEHHDRGRPGQRGRQLERDRAEAEELRAEDLQPEVQRRLVDREAAARLVGAEQEVVQRQRHAAHGGVVERVARHVGRATTGAARRRARRSPRSQRAPAEGRGARDRVAVAATATRMRNDRTQRSRRAGSPQTTRLAAVAEEVVEPIPPQPCSACRGTGVVISNLGGEPHELACPWCDGGGVHSARARRPGALARRRGCRRSVTKSAASRTELVRRIFLHGLKVLASPVDTRGKEGQHRRVTVVVCGAGAGTYHSDPGGFNAVQAAPARKG